MSDAAVPDDVGDATGGEGGGAAVPPSPLPVPRPARRKPSKGATGPAAVARAMIKAVTILLAFQFVVVHVQILLMHLGGGGDGDGAATAAGEFTGVEAPPERAAERAMSDAADAAAAVDGKRAGESVESSTSSPSQQSNPQDGSSEKKEKKEKKPKKAKKECKKKPPEPPKPKVAKKKPREPKPKPPPIVREVEVIKEVTKTRKLTYLTPEQLTILDEEEKGWEEELQRLESLADEYLSAGEGAEDVLDGIDTPLGAGGVRMARYAAALNKSKNDLADVQKQASSKIQDPRRSRFGSLVNQVVDSFDIATKQYMEGTAAAREERKKKLENAGRYVSDLSALLSVNFLGDLNGEVLGSRFDYALAQVSELTEPPVPTDEAWVWDPTADIGVIFELTGVGALAPVGAQCDAERMVRTDLPPLPHIPDEDSYVPEGAEDDEEEYDEEHGEDEDDEDEDDGNVARASDLFTLVGSIESVLRDRVGRYDVTDADDSDEPVGPLSTEEGEERFFAKLDELALRTRDDVDEMRLNAETDAAIREGGRKSCVDEDDLEEMVKGGLEALHRGRDPREVLEEIVRSMYDDPQQREAIRLDDNIDLKDFQHDAASPTSSPLLAGGGASMDEAMLRRIADDPLLARFLTGLDHVVEASAGHFDPVDRIIELLSGEDQDGSVGQTLEWAIRKGLGKLNLPKEVQEMREKAGVLYDRV